MRFFSREALDEGAHPAATDGVGQAAGQLLGAQLPVHALHHAGVCVAHGWRDEVVRHAVLLVPMSERPAQVVGRAARDLCALACGGEVAADVHPWLEKKPVDAASLLTGIAKKTKRSVTDDGHRATAGRTLGAPDEDRREITGDIVALRTLGMRKR